MGATERAYTSEYSYFGQAYEPKSAYRRAHSSRSSEAYGYAPIQAYAVPEQYPGITGVKRSREKLQLPEKERSKVQGDKRETAVLTHDVLFRAVAFMIFTGIILISTIWMSAKATEIQYKINTINKENILLQNEISMLDIKIESSNSIEQIEDYATGTLKMQYPKSQQCIYVDEGAAVSSDLAQQIREKAYKE